MPTLLPYLDAGDAALLRSEIERPATQDIASLPRGIDVPIAALLGMPLYVCATGSTPLAAMASVNTR